MFYMKVILIFTCSSIMCDRFGCNNYKYQKVASDCLGNIIMNTFPDSGGENSSTALLTIIVNNNISSQSYGIQSIIFKRIHDIFQVKVYSVEDDTYEFQLDTVSEHKKHWQAEKEHPSNFYLIILENEDDFGDVYEKLKKIAIFNPNAYHLLYIGNVHVDSETVSENLLKKMLDYFIAYTGVLVPESLHTFKFYQLKSRTRDSFFCGSQFDVFLLDTCEKGRMLNSEEKYFQSDTSTIAWNCTMNVIAKYYPPFVINSEEGFEVEVLKTIGSILNLHFDITVIDDVDVDDSWGNDSEDSLAADSNSVYNKIYIGVGNIDSGMEYATDFDFSHFYHMEPLIYVVPAAKLVPKWRILTAIFTIEMWAICIAAIILFAVTFYYVSVCSKQDFTGPQTSLLSSLQICIGQAVDKQPVNDMRRIFFVSLSIFSIIISSIYTCSLIYYLKNTIKQEQIKNSDDLFDVFGHMTYDIGGISKYRMFYNVTESPEIQEIFENYQSVQGKNDTVEYWLELVGNRDDLWTISSEFFVKYLLAINSEAITHPDGQPKVYPLNQKLMSYPVSMIMRRGHPLLRRVNTVIRRLLRGGFVYHFCEKYLSEIGKDLAIDNTENTTPSEALTLEHLQGAFAMLILGYMLGGITLLFEQFLKNHWLD